MGLALLGTARDLLAGIGANEAIRYVDDDVPAGDLERDHTAAKVRYDRTGFTELSGPSVGGYRDAQEKAGAIQGAGLCD